MLAGAYYFPTDYGIDISELARALEERGFDALFVCEHTHIPTSRKTPFPGGGELPKLTLPCLGGGTGVDLSSLRGPMVLSLSPGPSLLEQAAHLQAHANQWRVCNDFWDTWPQLRDNLVNLVKWAPHSRPGAWAFWWPRFVRIAAWLVAEERAHRSGVVESFSECRGSLTLAAPGGPFTLTAKADRIDRLAAARDLRQPGALRGRGVEPNPGAGAGTDPVELAADVGRLRGRDDRENGAVGHPGSARGGEDAGVRR